MPTDGSSQIDSLWDSCATFVLSAYDAYGWVVPALLLTLLFFTLIAAICWALDDIVEAPVLEGPRAIFRWCRQNWEPQRGMITLSPAPSSSSPSERRPSSYRE